MSVGKTLQSSSLQVLVKSGGKRNNVSCCHDMTEIMLKAALNTIQSIQSVCTISHGVDLCTPLKR